MLYIFVEFQIQGYVGCRIEFGGGKVLKVSIVVIDSWKDKDSGELCECMDWNIVIFFECSMVGFVWLKENLKFGDFVYVRGWIGESNYVKDGQIFYEILFMVDWFVVVLVGKDG